MSGLFVELYLNEDVDVLVADLLRARGFVAVTTHDAGQLAHAAAHQQSLLTHNRDDFETLARDYFASGRTHYGIIISVRRLPHDIVRRLLLPLNQVTGDEMRDVVRYI